MEIIEDLETIVKNQLMYFNKKTNGLKPQRIIFFRDGVSEGQFAEVSFKLLHDQLCHTIQLYQHPHIWFQ
jgi:hypothetical protein